MSAIPLASSVTCLLRSSACTSGDGGPPVPSAPYCDGSTRDDLPLGVDSAAAAALALGAGSAAEAAGALGAGAGGGGGATAGSGACARAAAAAACSGVTAGNSPAAPAGLPPASAATGSTPWAGGVAACA